MSPISRARKYMGVFLDFNGSGTPQIVAGFSEVSPMATTPSESRSHLRPILTRSRSPIPIGELPVFGTPLPQFTGTVFLQNSPTTPNLEFRSPTSPSSTRWRPGKR